MILGVFIQSNILHTFLKVNKMFNVKIIQMPRDNISYTCTLFQLKQTKKKLNKQLNSVIMK